MSAVVILCRRPLAAPVLWTDRFRPPHKRWIGIVVTIFPGTEPHP